MDKGFNDESGYFRRIAAIRATGIGVQAGIIVGLDGDDATVFQRTLRFLQQARIDALQLAILTPQPGTVLYDEFERAGRIIDRDWRHYDFRHAVIRPARMTARQLQDGADWLYRQFYRLDRIILRTARAALTVGLVPAYLIWRLNMTYRYDNRREGIVGKNPALKSHTSPWVRLLRRAWTTAFPSEPAALGRVGSHDAADEPARDNISDEVIIHPQQAHDHGRERGDAGPTPFWIGDPHNGRDRQRPRRVPEGKQR